MHKNTLKTEINITVFLPLQKNKIGKILEIFADIINNIPSEHITFQKIQTW